MDCYHTSKAQVVVQIKEGNGFTFLTSPVVVVASFNGIQLETKEILPSNCPQFDSELIWQADTKYLRRLRTANTALKLECFTFVNNHKQNSRRDRIGYILLNLKEAQIVTNYDHKSVSETRHRLLGMKNVFQSHKPELVLRFKIEETIKMQPSLEEDHIEKVKVDSNFQSGDSSRLEMFRNQLHGQLLIGPPHLCTEFYELAISVISVGNLSNIIPKERVDSPVKAHFIIFGYSFFTKDLSIFRENMNNGRISIKIWSQLHFIAAYFKEFPTLLISIYSEEEIIGTALVNLQVLGNLTTKRNITINDKIIIEAIEYTDKFNSGIDLPFLEMEFQLYHQKDLISTKVDQETQSNYDYNFEKDPGNATQFSPSSFRYESSLASHKEDVEESGLSDKNVAEPIITNHAVENTSIPRQNPGMDIHHEHLNSSEVAVHDEYDPPIRKDYYRKDIKGATIKICEELEDWKEKQQEMFRFELKRKTERHLKKLSNEWLKKKCELEEDLKKRIEDCQMLKEKLITALEDLTQRSEQLAMKEEELKIAKEELDKKYTMKFQELRKASKLHEFDMEDKIHEVTAEKTELYKKLEESRKEILRLQDALLNQEVPNHSKEQTASLISEIRSLEQKLEKAVESKTFFKEQWGKAVRELHKMKEEEQRQLKWQIQKNRQELQTLGLVKEISQEVGEMKKDQSTIKNIRNELANFISANNEPLMDHFQNTY